MPGWPEGFHPLRACSRLMMPAATGQGARPAGELRPADPDTRLSLQCHVHPREFPEDVARLMEQAGRASLESSSSWFSLQVDQALDVVDVPLFYVLRRGLQVLAVFPLMLTPGIGKVLRGRQLESLSNFYTSLYALLLSEESPPSCEELSFMLRELRRRHHDVVRWQFGPLDPGTPSHALLNQAARQAGLVTFSYFRFGNWFMPSQSWQAYWDARDSRMRNTIERKRRKLLAAGAQIEIITAAGERLDAGIAGYLQVYARSWKQAEPYPGFVPNLIKVAAEQGWLRLGLVWLDGQPVAAQIWLVGANKAAIFKLAYDEAFNELSAGSVLTAALMQHVLESDGVGEVDYLIGDDAYKRDWMSHRRERMGLLAYDPGNWRGLLGLLQESSARLLKRLLRAVIRAPQ